MAVRGALGGDAAPLASGRLLAALTALLSFLAGMNAAVRAVVRMGIYVGAKVYFIYEVSGVWGPAEGRR